MNILDHISKSLETIFWVKILKFFNADPDPGFQIWDGKIRIQDEHLGSATLGLSVTLKPYCYRICFKNTAIETGEREYDQISRLFSLVSDEGLEKNM